MLLTILSISPVMSLMSNNVIIPSTGRIAITIAPLTYRSEVRGVFVHTATFAYSYDFDLMAQTCEEYGINAVFLEVASFRGGLTSHQTRMQRLAQAIPAFHSRGIKVYVSMNVLYSPTEEQMDSWSEKPDGTPYAWACPTKQPTRDLIKAIVEDIARNYDIDGFMFDYIRYDVGDICYCSECRARFEAWLGEGLITDWTPFYPGGTRRAEFFEWRVIPITELVEDIRNWMLAIKPNMQFSLAAWTYFEDSPIYWRKWIGQDTGDWIRNDYLDMVAPMMYTSDTAKIEDYIQTNFKYMTGGPEGKIPLVSFISTGVSQTYTPTAFKAIVDKVRENGADGWIIWRYGGPGADPRVAPDIRDYLSIIAMPDTFTISNIHVSSDYTEATITWTTTQPTSSTVEYSTSPLFTDSWSIYSGFNYWDVDHIFGTVIEDETGVTDHSITLTELTPGSQYYYRIQSQDLSGTVTTKVLTFNMQEQT